MSWINDLIEKKLGSKTIKIIKKKLISGKKYGKHN